ncbi:2-oxoglutarate dehydrogenase E1 subunit family protein, partial [Amycolatopsis acididurans]|uniref:2-oxoglutarate dehydrogenase E1 subunit family protein n=1 Tax=Amycolatopsis acididurans TaxID=2724524 RepID=UPI001FE6997B
MSSSSPASQFGPNEWLVEEMYDQFLADPSSVDAAWHDFFSDFKPTQAPDNEPDSKTAAGESTAAETPATNGQAAAPA